ncbi:hypothetical protein KIN20_018166 [Parelaphostrongylus tenuis]|uniref:Uncharacterized protein n=1 Tax=Parelaphostrongylus tenuis TaxID=148309 RepID=A0AAD5N0S5_PARTN|nr:hypothetical protein KIN20_018166 [Parelaphostrongylus tenuis]
MTGVCQISILFLLEAHQYKPISRCDPNNSVGTTTHHCSASSEWMTQYSKAKSLGSRAAGILDTRLRPLARLGYGPYSKSLSKPCLLT